MGRLSGYLFYKTEFMILDLRRKRREEFRHFVV